METTQFVIEQASSFGGDFPDIMTRPDFQLEQGDDDPVFMTLPLGKVGNTSANNRLYDEAFYRDLVRLVNEQETPVRGIQGHPDPEKAAYETKLATHEWVGATIDDDGMVWGKAYIYPEEMKIRSDVKRAKMRGYKVATSLRGNGEMDGNRVTSIHDLWIDYVDAERAGVAAAVDTPHVTSEMTEQNETIEDNDMSENNNADVQALQTTIAEMKVANSAMTSLMESVQAELGNPENVLEAIQELRSERDTATRSLLGFTARNLVDNKVEFEGARPIIAEMIGLNYATPEQSRFVETDADAISTRIDNLLAQEYVQNTIKALVSAASGGRVRVGELADGDEIDDSPEALARAKREFGL